jgi:hypothetical protein
MWEKIRERIPWPLWADARYKRLGTFDLLLDGQFYQHLRTPFLEDLEAGGQFVPIWSRRPLLEHNVLSEAASRVARRLFAGDHAPHVRAEDPQTQALVDWIRQDCRLDQRMLQAAYWGTVGSVAVTFGFPEPLRVPTYEVWRAKCCDPQFFPDGRLLALLIRFPVRGEDLLRHGLDVDGEGQPVLASSEYWWIREYGLDHITTYRPVRTTTWKPQDGTGSLVPITEDPWSMVHDLGMVLGVWITNLAGGDWPDGACLWERAIPAQVHLDYTLSQIGRGLWYSAVPQPVIKGRLENVVEQGGHVIYRTPTNYFQVPADRVEPGGGGESGADVKLLESNGRWITAALDYIERVRQIALEQIGLSRKDPNKITGIMSGKAMEILEGDETDLIQELRTAYGTYGLVPIVRATIQAGDRLGIPGFEGAGPQAARLVTIWPRPYRATADELQKYVGAFQQGVEQGFFSPEEARHALHTYADLEEAASALGEPAPEPSSADEQA